MLLSTSASTPHGPRHDPMLLNLTADDVSNGPQMSSQGGAFDYGDDGDSSTSNRGRAKPPPVPAAPPIRASGSSSSSDPPDSGLDPGQEGTVASSDSGAPPSQVSDSIIDELLQSQLM
jgi:hypothetical protein